MMKRAAVKTQPTIDQLLAMQPKILPDVPQWAPDGKSIAFVSALSGQPELWTIDARGGYPRRMTVGMGNVRFLGSYLPRRSPDGKWVAYLSEKSGTSEVWLQPSDGSASRQLTHLGGHINAFSWAPDSQSLVLSGNRYGSFDIYRADVPGGEAQRLTDDVLNEVYPVFAPDGQVLYVRLDEAWADHEVVSLPAGGGAGQVIARDTDFFDYHYGRTFGQPLVSPDGETVLFRSHRSGYINYWQVPIEGGRVSPFAEQEADQSEAAWSPDGESLAFISNHNGTLSLCVAPADGSRVRVLVDPGMGVCAMPQWSPDGSEICYYMQTPTAPMDLWVISVAGGEARQLSQSMLVGDVGSRLVTPEKVSYKSFDGLTIHGYLYKPPFIEPGDQCPGILWIHGGPTSQWFDALYPNLQFFALQGYVVLAPNIRGSSGYGKAFEDLNNRDWGHDDLRDAVAGAEYLQGLGYVHPGKLAITGTSYGGCLSMSAVCFAPDVFQAAIPASGYADWIAMYYEQELRHIKLLEYEFGPFESSQEIYRKCSPMFAADKARTPTFVIHGEGKLPRSSASYDFFQALSKEYKTVQYKAYPGECYYVRSASGTRQMWLDMLEFLDRYLGE